MASIPLPDRCRAKASLCHVGLQSGILRGYPPCCSILFSELVKNGGAAHYSCHQIFANDVMKAIAPELCMVRCGSCIEPLLEGELESIVKQFNFPARIAIAAAGVAPNGVPVKGLSTQEEVQALEGLIAEMVGGNWGEQAINVAHQVLRVCCTFPKLGARLADKLSGIIGYVDTCPVRDDVPSTAVWGKLAGRTLMFLNMKLANKVGCDLVSPTRSHIFKDPSTWRSVASKTHGVVGRRWANLGNN